MRTPIGKSTTPDTEKMRNLDLQVSGLKWMALRDDIHGSTSGGYSGFETYSSLRQRFHKKMNAAAKQSPEYSALFHL